MIWWMGISLDRVVIKSHQADFLIKCDFIDWISSFAEIHVILHESSPSALAESVGGGIRFDANQTCRVRALEQICSGLNLKQDVWSGRGCVLNKRSTIKRARGAQPKHHMWAHARRWQSVDLCWHDANNTKGSSARQNLRWSTYVDSAWLDAGPMQVHCWNCSNLQRVRTNPLS